MYSIHSSKIIIPGFKFISIMICLFLFMDIVPALGQFFPYALYPQSYLTLFQNPYGLTKQYNGFNPYNGLNSFNGLNVYTGLYNPFSLLSTLSTSGSSSFYPQATTAGSLIPFNNPFTPISPLNYLAGALTPFNPLTYLYRIAGGPYFIAATVDVSGSWIGTWTSTFLAGGVTTGDITMTLAQLNSDVTGTVAFLLNKILKFGASVVGTVNGDVVTLTGTIVPGAGGTKTYDVTLTATVTGTTMNGTYLVINTATSAVAEEGTFTATMI